MKNEIQKELLRLEQQHNIEILYAVESGSRAWGFESVDSDWDVRYIYIHNTDWYLQIDDKKDSMDEILPNDIDLSGWELRKALRLFRKSNPPMLEWLRSPIVYKQNDLFINTIRNLSNEYFNPTSCIHHYLSMSAGNYQKYIQKDIVNLKKYFYVLRPLLACDWIVKNGTPAPVLFSDLLTDANLNDNVRDEIQKLLTIKMSGGELYTLESNPILNEFIDQKIEYYKEYTKSLKSIIQPNTSKLNELFKQTLLLYGVHQ